ncbi:hypothetical protein [Methyloversatilis sp.]|uniref:hypothetical protein n=1 Tax=Methyloversatilis sp. TaxID=2569862 RepID=UPI0027339A81|nr:hypothetical protein [Methyloversatilis sp.]MDP2869767.1 hypothetical protein [Methyloversatilis sp.]MDP3287406.1 hypothetical protein [Methyloversatilis sp.]MDP3454713.1 hypothetical protein [Methyloversatilis sp.]MDP3579321.1 hypothetical protein [Methyloversatilis sp.]
MNDRTKNDLQHGFGATADTFADALAHTAGEAIRSSNQIAHQTLDQLADRVDSARLQAAPVFDRLAHRADEMKYRGVAAVREGSQRLRYQAVRATDSTLGYVRHKPVQSLLFAAALGAAVTLLLSVVGRAGKPRD